MQKKEKCLKLLGLIFYENNLKKVEQLLNLIKNEEDLIKVFKNLNKDYWSNNINDYIKEFEKLNKSKKEIK